MLRVRTVYGTACRACSLLAQWFRQTESRAQPLQKQQDTLGPKQQVLEKFAELRVSKELSTTPNSLIRISFIHNS